MNAAPALSLRDIHLPPEPSWWPPAPGWWLLALVVGVALAFATRGLLRRRRARRRLARLRAEFDAAAAVADPPARVAAISQLLRRAALQRDPGVATLHGEDWLRFLDGAGAVPGRAGTAAVPRDFSAGPGRVLLDGPYRRAIDPAVAAALVAPARTRFEALIDAKA
jgi:hypothetical protein